LSYHQLLPQMIADHYICWFNLFIRLRSNIEVTLDRQVHLEGRIHQAKSEKIICTAINRDKPFQKILFSFFYFFFYWPSLKAPPHFIQTLPLKGVEMLSDITKLTNFHSDISHPRYNTSEVKDRRNSKLKPIFPEGVKLGKWHQKSNGKVLNKLFRKKITIISNYIPSTSMVAKEHMQVIGPRD
jgi:hypothetical protein